MPLNSPCADGAHPEGNGPDSVPLQHHMPGQVPTSFEFPNSKQADDSGDCAGLEFAAVTPRRIPFKTGIDPVERIFRRITRARFVTLPIDGKVA